MDLGAVVGLIRVGRFGRGEAWLKDLPGLCTQTGHFPERALRASTRQALGITGDSWGLSRLEQLDFSLVGSNSAQAAGSADCPRLRSPAPATLPSSARSVGLNVRCLSGE